MGALPTAATRRNGSTTSWGDSSNTNGKDDQTIPLKVKPAFSEVEGAQGLLELESAYLRGKIGTMNSYDVVTILNFINIVAADFHDENRMASNSTLSQLSQRSSILPGRVQLAALNASLDKTDATPSETALSLGRVGNEGGELPEPANGVIASIDPQEELPDLIERNPRNPGEALKPNIVSTVL